MQEPPNPPGQSNQDASRDKTALGVAPIQKNTSTMDTAPVRKGPRKPVILIVIVAVVAAAFYYVWNATHQPDPNKLRVSGRIEGYETNVGAKVAGRVEFIAAREGDVVKVGQLIVRLSDEDIQAQLRGAQARLEKAQSDRQQAAQQLDVVRSQIQESELNERQSKEDAQGRIYQAEAQVAGAQANLAEAQAQVTQSTADWKLAGLRKDRYQKLAQRGAVAQDDADQAATTEATTAATVDVRKAAVISARKQLMAAQGGLTQARTNRFNPNIRGTQVTVNKVQLTRAKSALEGVEHDIVNAKAECDQIKANIAYLNIRSPIEAIVTARPVEPGAVVAAGQTVLSLIDLKTVFLRGFIPEGDIGRVRVGQAASVFLDSADKTALPAKVSEIDPEASFTPENIYFKDDRVKQVFGMKIAIDNPGGYAKPGMPADAAISTARSQR